MIAECELLGLGEPVHREPAFPLIRNELFATLVERGFRSIALETDRVAALAVDEYVRGGAGTLDAVMRDGFTHDFGRINANRGLVAWLREHNDGVPEADRVAFHGFDVPTETMNAPSPRAYLEHARDYLGLDVDIAGPAGPDERWSRTEAVLDRTQSPGATADADRLRALADDLLAELDGRAPALIAATSLTEWRRARIHLKGGLALLRYHRQCAAPLEPGDRYQHLFVTRDALMARNLLAIRAEEAHRGPTLAFAHNLHLRRTGECAGAVLGALLGDRYAFVAGSIGRSAALGLGEPEPDTYEGRLQPAGETWTLTEPVTPARTRTDPGAPRDYFPLDAETLDGAHAVLHIPVGAG